MFNNDTDTTTPANDGSTVVVATYTDEMPDYVFADFGGTVGVIRFRDDAFMYATVADMGVADGTYPCTTTDMGTTFDVVIYDGAVSGINP